ncbi:MAG: Asp-tRNA(Asn)/Glu-tRNA(Gln) amidotransferase subunit GatA [Deltaproteobacteria bacterium]|nr:Asp-tRNA(Asn)/Glu-tRNA(Gln) amidotransferase subunit GatA [Deltaproteobacteria bacterium]
MTLHSLTLHEIHEKLRKREVSSVELTQAVLKQIAKTEDKIHAFITLTEELALAQAKQADDLIQKNKGASPNNFAPLTGIPIALKDIFLMKGTRTTCGSRILSNYVAPYTATSVDNLLKDHAVIIGKLNMDEFAMGSSNETSHFGICHNPWDLKRIPGGSSGGSAAAVAAGDCFGATGTDTGGSIRLPAAFCNLVGIKPTYGRVSRYGVIAFASSLDQVGPLAKDVTDCAILLKALAGHDPRDSTSLNLPVPDYTASLTKDVRGMTIGIPKEYFVEGLDPEIEKAVRTAIDHYQKLGAKIIKVSLPHTTCAVPTYYILAPAEASSNLARYDGIRYGFRHPEARTLLELYTKSRTEGFGPEVKRRIMLGTYVLSAGYYDAYYLKAQKARTLIRNDFEEAFKQCDLLLTPVAPTAAWKIGEKTDDPLKMYLSDIFTINVNLAGLPAMSLPCGFTKGGLGESPLGEPPLPIGMQLIGNHFKEETIFRAAFAYEQANEWHQRRPAL